MHADAQSPAPAGSHGGKAGTRHFVRQRASAMALAVLVPWLLVALALTYPGAVADPESRYRAVQSWIGAPPTAILLALTLSAGLYHAALGLEVIIEDYFTRPAGRRFWLLASGGALFFLWAVSIVSILKIALGGAA